MNTNHHIRMPLAAVAVLMISGVVAEGSVFSWDFAPSPGDLLSIKLQNWEPGLSTVLFGADTMPFTGDEWLFGVGRVTQIDNATSGFVAWQNDANSELTFIFSDFLLSSVVPALPVAMNTVLNFTGGKMELFFDDTPDTNGAFAGKPEGTNAAPDATAGFDFTTGSGGMKVLELTGHANSVTGFSLSTTVSAVSPSFSGTGVGFFDVLLGSGANGMSDLWFDNNAMGDLSDFKFLTTLQPITGAAATDYPIFSSDPITTTFVPEPVSLLVWGGLLALAVAITRRRRAIP